MNMQDSLLRAVDHQKVVDKMSKRTSPFMQAATFSPTSNMSLSSYNYHLDSQLPLGSQASQPGTLHFDVHLQTPNSSSNVTSNAAKEIRKRLKTIEILSARKKSLEIGGPLLNKRRNFIAGLNPMMPIIMEAGHKGTSPLDSYRSEQSNSHLSRFHHLHVPAMQKLSTADRQKLVVYSQLYYENTPSPELTMYVNSKSRQAGQLPLPSHN